MASPVRDTTGAIRIPHSAQPSLTPCNCRCRLGECSCMKNYCPCRKAGFYCGASCKCSNHSCGNQPPPSEQTEQKVEQTQQPLNHEDKVSEDDLEGVMEILMMDDFDVRHLLDEF